jgi:hypothetical protein
VWSAFLGLMDENAAARIDAATAVASGSTYTGPPTFIDQIFTSLQTVGLGFVRVQLAALRLEKAHVSGEAPGLRPHTCLDAMEQRVAQGVPPRRRLCARRPTRQLSRQRLVMGADGRRAEPLGHQLAHPLVTRAVRFHPGP